MKNEIICYAQGYTPNKLDNLVKSFKKNVNNSSLESRIVILTDDFEYTDERDVVSFKVRGIKEKYNVDSSLSPYTLKVIYFYLYCKHFSTAENVFLCDATDVFINDDPFELVTDKVSVFVENEKIGNCPVNSEWMRICYNHDILNILKGKPILNGGLILGKRLKCIELLKEMCTDLANIIGRVGNYRNPDQAVLNKVIYFDQLNYHISTDNSMINCAHLTKLGLTPTFHHGIIDIFSKSDGVMPHVVHQYPCFKGLEVKW